MKSFYNKVLLKKNIIYLILLILCFTPIISAMDSLGTFKQGEIINLHQYCDSCTYVNLTNVKTADNNYSMNIAMIKTGTSYDYPWNETSVSGNDCSYTICGDKEGEFTCEDLKYNITPNGTLTNTSQGIIYLVLILITIGLLIFFLFLAFSIEGNNEYNNGYVIVNWKKYFRYFFWFMSYLMLMFVIVLSQQASDNFLWFSSLSSFFHMLFIFSLIGLGIILIIGIPFIFMSFILDKKYVNNAKRNLKIR
jgi:hypothetical protein